MYFLLFFIFIFVFLIYRSNSFIDISRFEIKVEENLKNFDNFKIVQISDLQNNNFNGKLEKIIYEENPNVVFITGDLLDCYNTDEEVALSVVSNLVNKFPIFFVSGNHEARVENYKNFEEKLERLGVIVLNNSSYEYFIEEQKINILGLEDPRFQYFELPSTTVRNEINKFDLRGFNILLSHRPELFEIYVENQINLVFSGHAHGGQIRIPFTKMVLISPDQGFFPKLIDGLYEKRNTKMIVSRGLGNSKKRLRFNNPYNLVIVKLKSY